MKIYDNDTFSEINDVEKEEYFNNLVQKQIEFISKIVNEKCDINTINDRVKNLQVVRFKESNPRSFNVIDNGKIVSVRANPNAAAFFGIRKIENGEDKKEITNAIFISNTNSKHTVTHELFHALSSNTEITYDENGKGYNKKGLKIIGYDKEDNILDRSLNADALNEGMTEMLAMKFDNSKHAQSYDVYTYIADILNVDTTNSLLNAYFLSDIEVFKNFLKEFDEKQKVISSEELVSMSSKENLSFDKMLQVINACTEYTMSFCKTTEEFNIQKDRLNTVFEHMKDNINVMENVDEIEKFQNNIDQTFENLEFMIQDGSKKTTLNIIDEAIDKTKEYTTLADINKVGGELQKYMEDKNKEYNIE